MSTDYNQQQQYYQQQQQYYQYLQYQEQQNNKKANTLCTISLILGLLGGIVLPIILAAVGHLFPVDPVNGYWYNEWIKTANLIPSFITGMCSLGGFVLMIVARCKYPNNKFAKVLMWIYIVAIIIYVLLVIAALVACVYLLSQCIP